VKYAATMPSTNTPKTILVPTDFSELASQALEYAVGLAARLDAKIHLLHVITASFTGVRDVAHSSSVIDASSKEARIALDQLAARYRDRVSVESTRIEIGDPREVIDQVAEKIGADLIAMGTHGRRGVKRMLLGSVAESVVRSAPCPVLTIRPKS
jgi:nucleotide-binding universal stress UspA family protein